MRNAFIKKLTELAETDSSIVLVTGDLGFGILDDFRSKFPTQYYNFGVAEQNLSGVGSGLALAGHTVFTYSIGNFPTLRCLEQIRNDACYHQANLKIVAVGGGMAYGALGPSHFATEDLAIMRSLPGMTVVAPGDPYEVEQLLPQIVARPGPVYLRLGRAGEPLIHDLGDEIVLGKPVVVKRGEDILLLSIGGMLPVVMETAVGLSSKHSIEVEVASVHTLSPLPEESLLRLVSGKRIVMTCEEHSIRGGLGGAVAEILAESGYSGKFRRFGLRPVFPSGIGSQEYLRSVNGLDASALTEAVLSLQG